MSTFKKTRLTKKFLMEQMQGPFIVSNVNTDERVPVFAEKVKSLEKRQSQWERIKKAGADNRVCRVYTGPTGQVMSRCLYLIKELERIKKEYDKINRQVKPCERSKRHTEPKAATERPASGRLSL